MKLRRLRARNLGPLVHLDSPLFFDGGNILVGPNDAGKSTFRRALSLLLTGTCDGYESGQGLAKLRSTHGDPSKKWGLQMEFVDAKGEVHTFQRRDDEGPRSKAQDLIESLTGCPGPKARACLYTGTLLDLDAKARQRLILDLAPRASIEIPAEVRAAIKAALAEDHASADVDTLDRLHKAVYAEREATGREVKAHGSLEAPAPPEGFEDLAGSSLANLDAEAAEMRTQITDLARERDAALARSRPVKPDTAGPQAEVMRLDRALAGVLKEIEGIPTPEALQKRAKELAKKRVEAETENQALDDRRRDLSARHGEAKGTAARAKQALDTLKAQPKDASDCPICATKLKAATLKTVLDTLTKQWESGEREAQRIKVELDTVPDPLSTLEIQREADGVDAKARRRHELEAEADRLEQDLKAARAKLDEAQAAPETPGDAKADIEADELSERIERGNALIEALREYAGARRTHAQGLARKAAVEARYAALTQLLEALGPNGIRKAIGGGDGLFRLHEDLNATLQPLGFKVDLRPVVDLEGDPRITRLDTGVTFAAGDLSNSGRIRFGAALAIAVAKFTGLGLVVIDDFEALAPESLDSTLTMLEDSGCQWFALAVRTMDADEFEQLAIEQNAAVDEGRAGTRYYHVQAGEISSPGAVEAGEAA
jgi:hypothetical protein